MDLASPLIEDLSPFLAGVLCGYVAFSVLVVMNLVTGVFVEGAQRLSKEDKDKELVKMAYRTFNAVDDDANSEKIEDQHHSSVNSVSFPRRFGRYSC